MGATRCPIPTKCAEELCVTRVCTSPEIFFVNDFCCLQDFKEPFFGKRSRVTRELFGDFRFARPFGAGTLCPVAAQPLHAFRRGAAARGERCLQIWKCGAPSSDRPQGPWQCAPYAPSQLQLVRTCAVNSSDDRYILWYTSAEAPRRSFSTVRWETSDVLRNPPSCWQPAASGAPTEPFIGLPLFLIEKRSLFLKRNNPYCVIFTH